MLEEKPTLKKLSSPEESVIVFVPSSKASFITGTCINVEGGQTISF